MIQDSNWFVYYISSLIIFLKTTLISILLFLLQIFPQKFLTNNISLTIFQIYNLCIEEDYDPSHFHGRVEKVPFDDNHVPTFEMMKVLCESVHSWLSNDPKNIAVIHCMVLLSSFFLFSLFLFNT